MITIYFLRHAETEYNAHQKFIGGRSNHIKLSESGYGEAKWAGRWFENEKLHFDGVACSSAERAKLTLAEIIVRSRIIRDEVFYTDALNEVCQGDWEGEPREDKLTPEILAQCVAEAPHFRAPNGETHKEAEERMMRFIQENILNNYTDGTFLLVGHGLSFKCLLQGIMGIDPKMTYKIGCANVSLSRLRYEERRGWFVDYINRDIISETKPKPVSSSDTIVNLTPREHIRMRPGMYIGSVGDGSKVDDGMYSLIHIALSYALRSYTKGEFLKVDISVKDNVVTTRDYGKATPWKLLNTVVTEIQREGKCTGQYCFGLLGVNSLSSEFSIRSVIDGRAREQRYRQGIEYSDRIIERAGEDGTIISYTVDEEIAGAYSYNMNYVEELVKEFVYLNIGVEITLNGISYSSKEGMLDMLNNRFTEQSQYPPIQLKNDDVDIAFTHTSHGGVEDYYLFANNLHANRGTLLNAFRKSLASVLNDYYKTEYDEQIVIHSLVATASIRVENAIFESAQKFKLATKDVRKGTTINDFVLDFFKVRLTEYLDKNPKTAELLHQHIKQTAAYLSQKKELFNKMVEWEQKHGITLSLCRSNLEKVSNNFEHYDIPKSVERINNSAFEGCSSLVSIHIPSGVRSIGDYAFKDCTSLREIIIPRNLWEIGKDIFPDNKSLKIKVHRGDRIFWRLLAQCGADRLEWIDE